MEPLGFNLLLPLFFLAGAIVKDFVSEGFAQEGDAGVVGFFEPFVLGFENDLAFVVDQSVKAGVVACVGGDAAFVEGADASDVAAAGADNKVACFV